MLAKLMELESGFPRTRSLVYCKPSLLTFTLHLRRPSDDHWHRRSLPRMLLKGCSINPGAYLGEQIVHKEMQKMSFMSTHET